MSARDAARRQERARARGFLALARGLAGASVGAPLREGGGPVVVPMNSAAAFRDAERELRAARLPALARVAGELASAAREDATLTPRERAQLAAAMSEAGEPAGWVALARWLALGGAPAPALAFLFAARARALAAIADDERTHAAAELTALRYAPALRYAAAKVALEGLSFVEAAAATARQIAPNADARVAFQGELPRVDAAAKVARMRPDEALLVLEAAEVGAPYDAEGRAAAAALRAAREEAAAAALAAEEAEL